jgi:hypothetical protein
MTLFMKIAMVALAFLLTLQLESKAQFDDSGFKASLKVKKGAYITDGSFTGGDRSHSDFRIQNIRLAANPAGYDRVVIDFAGNDLGQASALARPPYYMVDVDGLNKRVTITLYGKPKLDFSTQTALQLVKKTKNIESIQFLPIVHADRWVFVLEGKKNPKVEAFDLSQPARLIVDFKN